MTASGREQAGATASLPARWTAALATLLLTVVVVAWVVGVWLSTKELDEPIHPLDVVWVLSFLVFPAVGWLITVRLPKNPLGWIYLAYAVLALAGTAMEEVATLQAHAGNFATAATLIQGGRLAVRPCA